MTYLHTCRTCTMSRGDCADRIALLDAVKGLGIRSLKHHCAGFAAMYAPGDPVLIQTLAWMNGGDDDPSPKCWFPGHFVRPASRGVGLLCCIRKGAQAIDDQNITFEPGGGGFVKVPLCRVKPNPGGAKASVEGCRWCAQIPTLGQPCAKDPHYTPRGHCLAETLGLQAAITPPRDGEAREEPQATPGDRTKTPPPASEHG